MKSFPGSVTRSPIRLRPLLSCACAVVPLLVSAQAEAAPLPNGLNDWTTFYASFDHGLHAEKATGTPFSAGNYTEIVDGGIQGKALQAPNRLSSLTFAGTNLPSDKGTLRIWIKSPADSNIFQDNKEYFIAAAERTTPYRTASPETMAKLPGFNFLLYKSTSNEISFGVLNTSAAYLSVNGQLPPHPLPTSLAISTQSLDPGKWHEVAISWDLPRRKFWLRVGDQLREGSLPASFREGVFDYFMLANQPNFSQTRQGVFPGLLDELLISNHSLDEWLSSQAPTTATQGQATMPDWPRSQAVLFDAEPLKTMEAQLRTTLDTQARHQNKAGGWNFSFAYPSGLAFMSGTTRSPLPDNRYTNSKDSTSSLAALRYAMAYEALGDAKYLEVARRTAQAVLEAQQPDGWWAYSWSKTPQGIVIDYPDRIAIEDHVQSGPILLLLYLHRLTGDAQYQQAAMRGLNKLITMQNPNGSWSHHYNPHKKAGETQNGKLHGGEFNDFTTTGTMKVLLLGYRLTGEKRYLQAYLKGAQWILDAFIDKSATGGAIGWAQQYDEKNNPISARHFEPVALENFASAMAAQELMNAYRLTGQSRFLEPVKRWTVWLQGKLPKYSFYHDIETGRPIAMFQRQVYFTDDATQLAAYKAAVEKTGVPFTGINDKDWIGVNRIAQQLAAISTENNTNAALPTRAQLKDELQRGVKSMEKWTQTFNWPMATYAANGGSPGPRVPAGNEFWANVLWTLVRGRAIAGNAPLSHPLLRMPATFETGDEVNIVAAPHGLYERLPDAALQLAAN